MVLKHIVDAMVCNNAFVFTREYAKMICHAMVRKEYVVRERTRKLSCTRLYAFVSGIWEFG